jgi:hypothetical protein
MCMRTHIHATSYAAHTTSYAHTPITQEHGMSGGVAGVLLTGSALKGSVMAKGAALQEKLQSKSRYINAYIIS